MELSTVFSICFICCLLLKASLSAPVPAAEAVQQLEHRVEELTKQLHLLEENELHDRSRRTVSNVLNENRKSSFTGFLASYNACPSID